MIELLLLSIVAIFAVASFHRFGRKTKGCPPGPFCWPVIGNLLLLRKLSRTFGGQHFAFLELSRRFCSDAVMLRLGGSDMVAVSGYEGIQKILHSEEYDGRPWNEFVKIRNMGKKNGITMSDGPEWKEMRAWVVRSLKSIGFGRKEMSELIQAELASVLDVIKGGGVCRLKPIINPAVINVLWTLATGKRLCEGTRLQYFIELLERRARAFDMAGGILSSFPWMRYIAPEATGYKILTTLNKEVKEFLMETISDHKKNHVAGNEGDLIDMFLNEMYVGKGPAGGFTDDQLVMILVDLFIAGTNTTVTTLDFLFLNMTIHQDCQRMVQKEIDKVIGKERLPDLNDRLPYTEAVLTESQRMCLVTPIIGPRRVLRETKLLGYTIPKETTVLMNLWSIHMNPSFFPEPESFKPERFLKDGVHVPDEKLILFGQGKRRCPGEALARRALFLLFVGIMQQYHLLPVPGQEPPSMVHVPGLTISPKPWNVLLVPRQNINNNEV